MLAQIETQPLSSAATLRGMSIRFACPVVTQRPSTYRHWKPNFLLRWQTDGVKAKTITHPELHRTLSAARNPDFESRCEDLCGGAGYIPVFGTRLARATSNSVRETVDAPDGGVMSAVMTGVAPGSGDVGSAHTTPGSPEPRGVVATKSA